MGPPLITIYPSKLFKVINDHLPAAHAHADDAQLYLSFKPNTSLSQPRVTNYGQPEAIQARNSSMAIRAWMITDRSKLNNDKNEFLIIGMCPQPSKFEKLSISDVSFIPGAVVRNLVNKRAQIYILVILSS